MQEEKDFLIELQSANTQEQAFRKLVQLHQKSLYWHIRKIVITHEDADDVLQNTFIKAFRAINSFKGDSKLFSWLYRIATNESITFINKRAKERKTDITTYKEKLINSLQQDVLFDGEKIQIILQEAINKLPQKQQLVFNMKYFDNLKYDEMSEILDTSVGALKASYFHAVKKIKKHIENH